MAHLRADRVPDPVLHSISLHIISSLHIPRLHDGLFDILLQSTGKNSCVW